MTTDSYWDCKSWCRLNDERGAFGVKLLKFNNAVNWALILVEVSSKLAVINHGIYVIMAFVFNYFFSNFEYIRLKIYCLKKYELIQSG